MEANPLYQYCVSRETLSKKIKPDRTEETAGWVSDVNSGSEM